MAYTTIAAVRIATGFSDDTLITDALITQYIADADSVINAAIVDRYTLALASIPDIIETISRHITTALLYSNEYGEESEDTDKGWRGRMEWAMEQLENIKTGKLKLLDNTTLVELTRSELFQPVFKPTNVSSDPAAADTDAPRLTRNEQF